MNRTLKNTKAVSIEKNGNSYYSENIKESQDNVYYNVEFLGAPITAYGQVQQMIYDVTLNDAIVNNSGSYYMSVVDFAIPLTSVPLMIFPVAPNSALTNASTLNLNFVVNGVVQPSFNVTFVPERLDLPQPNQNDPLIPIITPYYFVYSYESMINMMNTTLTNAFNSMVAAFPAIVQSLNKAPFFTYDPSTQLISLITHISYATNTAPTDTVLIQVNSDLSVYLQGFSYNYLKRSGLPFSQFNITSYGENGYPSNVFPATITGYISTTESYVSIGSWSDLKKIIITTNSLPIAGESIARGATPGNIVNPQYILSSFTPQVEAAGEQRSTIYYNPSSQYRLIDIISDMEVRRIDVTIYWEDFRNNWYIMDLQPNDNATVRLFFGKKDLYKSNLLKKM